MRTSCVNVIMIGISICDLCNMIFMIHYDVNSFVTNECSPPNSYTFELINLFICAAEDNSRRLITWFGFLLASLRFFIVKNSLNPKFHHFSKPAFAIKTMLIALLISISLSTFYYGRISFVVGEVWSPPEQCSGFPSNYSAPVYEQYVQNRFLSEDSAALKTFSIVDGLLKLIASTTLPIFTYLLTKEHHNAKSTRRQLGTPRLEEPKNDHTTKLVILMAITFIVSESPFGILYFVEGIIINSPGIIHLTSDLIDLFGIFLAINATTSCLICLAVSSQYRKTAKELINYGRKKPTTVSLRKHLTSSATSKSFSMKTIN